MGWVVHDISLYQSAPGSSYGDIVMVLEMIIRSSLSSEDVYISGETKALFYESVLTFIEQVNDNQSQYYQPDVPRGSEMSLEKDVLLSLTLGPVSIQLLQEYFKVSLVQSSKQLHFLQIILPQSIVMLRGIGGSILPLILHGPIILNV